MKRKTKAPLFILAGIIGLIMPIIPGIFFMAYGIYLYFEPEDSVTSKIKKENLQETDKTNGDEE